MNPIFYAINVILRKGKSWTTLDGHIVRPGDTVWDGWYNLNPLTVGTNGWTIDPPLCYGHGEWLNPQHARDCYAILQNAQKAGEKARKTL